MNETITNKIIVINGDKDFLFIVKYFFKKLKKNKGYFLKNHLLSSSNF
jgi:hypothetical protein